MNNKTFVFEVHCKNAKETRNVINCKSDELFRYDDNYSDLYDYFVSYLNDIEDGPYTRFKADDNNPYSSADADGFENYLYYKKNGIYIQFNVDKGQITNWCWDDIHNEEYSCLEYNDFMFMIEQDIYKSDSIEKIINSDIVDKYCNKSNTNNNKNKDISTKSKPEVNFDILFDYGTLIGIGDRFVRKSDISAFVKEELDDDEYDDDEYDDEYDDKYCTVVVLKSGAKLTFHDIDYEEFISELDKYYRFKGDILE